MKKLCYVATVPAVVHSFLRGHIQAASKKNKVTVICNSYDTQLLQGMDARLILLPLERKPLPCRDALVFIQLIRLFRLERFDIVHSIMPKTGMLAMLAARLTGVSVRIHTFTGQVWVLKHDFRRMFLKWCDHFIGRLATCVLADSPSQREFLVKERVLPSGKAKVIGAGSICGVDAARFRPDSKARAEVRRELGIGEEVTLILFVGRLNREKGVLDLALAFNAIARHHPHVAILFVGAEENVTFTQIKNSCPLWAERLHYVNITAAPEHYMVAADIFCLPSYREGFGTTIIEAAACALPTVASRIYGITNAVVDGKTGLLFPAGDVAGLTHSLLRMISENDLRQQMGRAACARALELFSSEKITFERVMRYDGWSKKCRDRHE